MEILADERSKKTKPIQTQFPLKCQKCPIHLFSIRLFQLYQGDPVFAGVAGRLADGGRAGTGYFDHGIGLQRPAGTRIVPLYGESCRGASQVKFRSAASR